MVTCLNMCITLQVLLIMLNLVFEFLFNIIVGLCYFNVYKIYKFTKIFCLKMVINILFHLKDVMTISNYKNNIINIYYQVHTSKSKNKRLNDLSHIKLYQIVEQNY